MSNFARRHDAALRPLTTPLQALEAACRLVKAVQADFPIGSFGFNTLGALDTAIYALRSHVQEQAP